MAHPIIPCKKIVDAQEINILYPRMIKLKAALVNADMTGREIAERLGVSRGAVSKWLNRSLPVPDKHKREFAKLLCVTVDDLLPPPSDGAQ